MAGLVAAGFVLGLVMVALPLSALLAKILAYQAHKTIGLLVPPLVLWRLWLRARRGRPAPEPGPRWQRRAAATAHAALYALLLLVPVLGYLTASTAPGDIPTTLVLVIPVPHLLAADEAAFALLAQIHATLAWALVGLAAAHAAVALLHHRAGSAVLQRLWRG